MLIGIIPDIYCTNCVHAHIYHKEFTREPMLTCIIGRQKDISLKNVVCPLACNEVKLISKLGDD